MSNHISSSISIEYEWEVILRIKRDTFFKIVNYELDSWIWEILFVRILVGYNATLFIGHD